MSSLPLVLGRYTLFAELASGGMATVYLGRLNGPVGFGRTVAVKRLHPHLTRDPNFAAMFLDEARLAARIQHPNVVPTIDVVTSDDEVFLVLEYVRGESLAGLLRAVIKANVMIPVPIAVSILIGALNGLHAAHEAVDEQGQPLDIVHRDMSPQNLIVGADGIARVLDFGVAKAAARLQTTREGQLKGKVPYMSPEQLRGQVTRQTDVYAAGIVLWETLACQRLFAGESEAEMLTKVMHAEVPPPSDLNADVPPELDRVVMKALERNPAFRYWTAREMAQELDECTRPASSMQVAEWMEGTVGPLLAERSALVAQIESGASSPSLPFPSSRVTELRSSSVVSHTLPSLPPPVTHVTRTRLLLGGVIAAALAIFVVAAVAFRMGASRPPPDPGASLASAPPAAVPSASTPPATPASTLPLVPGSVAPQPRDASAAVPTTGPAPPREVDVRDLPLPPPANGQREGKGRGRSRPGAAAGTGPATGTPSPASDLNTLLDTH
jgi:serine/threonine-protein kinase